MSDQLQLPVEVSLSEIARKPTLGAAIELCIEAGGYLLNKQVGSDLGVDKAQLSRWQSNKEGITWPKLQRVMDVCGNDAPVLWQVHQRGYDLSSLRRRETETERENRLLREENAALRRVLMGERS